MSEGENRKSGFIRDIIGCLTSPRGSFKSILEKPSLKKATVLILVIAIAAGWASFNYTGKLPLPDLDQDQRPVGLGQFTQVIVMMSAMMALIGVFGTWLLSSVLVHGIARPLGGKGTFRSMLTLAGYASTPLLIQHVLRLADSFMISQEALQLTASLQISVDPLLNSIANAAVGIFTIFRLWSIALLIIATHENYKMSTIRSTVPTVLSFVAVTFVSVFLPFM
ncbi:MAG: YIP1 family protein [Candidatus Bathyarchaeota archaeon]|nr:YIP1 family protein [Candidatus Bathyarchaeota archaeon]MDH5732943.1 YIP1 family protein [Candidatus Bathyarchaeota archaeon]